MAEQSCIVEFQAKIEKWVSNEYVSKWVKDKWEEWQRERDREQYREWGRYIYIYIREGEKEINESDF